jgi:hypothetical protein
MEPFIFFLEKSVDPKMAFKSSTAYWVDIVATIPKPDKSATTRPPDDPIPL